MTRLKIILAWIQGTYFAATGLWPVVSIRSFQAVTGQKTDHLVTGYEQDHWLVNTVAVLVIAIGLALLVAAWRRHVPLEITILAAASAFGLAMIDVVYVARQTIWPIYLVDAVAQVGFLAGWSTAEVCARPKALEPKESA